MKNIDVEGLGVVEFPDGMSQEDIEKAIHEQWDKQAKEEPPTPVQLPPGVKVKGPKEMQDVSKVALPLAVGATPESMRPHPERLTAMKESITEPIAAIPKLPSLKEHPETDPVEQGIIGVAEQTVGGAGQLAKALIPKDVKTQALRSSLNQAIGAAEFVESPLGIASLGAGAAAPTLTSAAFSVDMLASTLKQIGVTSEKWSKMTTAEKADSLINIGASGVFTGLTGFHAVRGGLGKIRDRRIESALKEKEEADASKEQKTAEVHGDVRTQPAPASAVPQPGGGEGVQPQAPGVAKETQVSLGLSDPMKAEMKNLGFTDADIATMTEREARDTLAANQPEGAKPKVDPNTILLSEFDAGVEGSQIIDWISEEYGVSKEEAAKIHERSRKHYGIGAEGKPQGELGLETKPEGKKPPPVPGTVLPEGITQNPSGTFTVKYTEWGIEKKASFKTREEAEEWLKQKQAKPSEPNRALQYAVQKGKDKGSKVEPMSGLGGEIPFAAGGVATGRNGVIYINEPEFVRWLSEMPEGQRVAAIERMIDEEHIHANTTNLQATRYWRMLTPFEKLLVRRRYLGREFGQRITDAELGHEALRGRIQRMSKEGIREAVDSARLERWTSKSLSALEGIINYIREKLGTRASAIQRKILNKVQENLKAVRDGAERPEAQAQPPAEEPQTRIKNLKQARDEGDLQTWNTPMANDAGMAMRTVDDLNQAAETHAAVKKEYTEAGKEIPTDKVERVKHIEKMLRLGHELQMIREAVETATNSGSGAQAEMERLGIDLGERPLDHTDKPEVKAWLDKNAQSMGISHGETAPMTRRKGDPLKYPVVSQMPKMDRELEEKILEAGKIMASRTSIFKQFAVANNTYGDLDTALANLAATDPSKWNMRSTDRAALLEWFKNSEDSGWGRGSVLANRVNGIEEFIVRQMGEVEKFEDTIRRMKMGGKDPAFQGTEEEWKNVIRQDEEYASRVRDDLINLLDETKEERKHLEKLTGERYPLLSRPQEISEDEGPLPPTGFEQPPPPDHPEFPFARRKGKWKMGKYEAAGQQKFWMPGELPEEERPRVSAEASGALPKIEGEEALGPMTKVTEAEKEGRLPHIPYGTPINASELDSITLSYLNSKLDPQTNVRPSFEEFTQWARRRLRVRPDQVADLWREGVWRMLVGSKRDNVAPISGERAEKWVAALNLENKLVKPAKGEGTARIRSVASAFTEAQSAEEATQKAREGLLEKASRLEKKATKLEGEGEALKRKAESAKLTISDPFERMTIDADWQSRFAQAKKARSDADELVRAVREGDITLPQPKEAKPVDRAARASKLRRQAKSIREYAEGLTGDSTQLKAATTMADGLDARADMLEAGVDPESAEAVKGRTPQENAAIKAQQFRSKVISEIAGSLIRESIPKDYDLHRTELSVGDIDFENEKASEDAYHEISARDLKSPVALRLIFGDAARRRSDDPVSVTKRVAVVRDTKTGKVFMVSAFPEGRTGIRIMDPYGSGHISMVDNLKRYQPVASVLLKSAVKDFKWAFDDMKSYNEQFGKAAHEESGQAKYKEFAGEQAMREEMLRKMPEEEPEVEGTEGIKTSSFIGEDPFREGRGTIERMRKSPLTAGEVESVLDYVTEHLGTDVTKEQFGKALEDEMKYRLKESEQYTGRRKKGALTGEELVKRSGQRLLRGMHRNVLSAITKIANFIYREEREMIPRVEAYAKALDHIYEAIQKNKQVLLSPEGAITSLDYGRIIPELMGRFTRASRQERTSAFGYALRRFMEPRAVGRTVEIGGGIYGRERFRESPITTTKESPIGRVPPTVVREGQVPKGAIPERRPAPAVPEGSPGKVIPPEMLSEADKAFVEERARNATTVGGEKLSPYKPTVAEEMTPPLSEYPEEPGEAPQARRKSLRRAVDSAEEAWVTGLHAIEAGMVRRDVKDTMSAWADKADNEAVIMSRKAGQAVRVWGDNPLKKNAAIAAISSGGDMGKVKMFVKMCDTAIAQSKRDLAGPNRKIKIAARARLAAAEELKEGAQYLLDNPSDVEIHNLANAAQRELRDTYNRETKHGIRLHWEPDYVPSRYEGEFFNDDAVMFWEQRVLGLNFRKPKVFPNYYEAIATGPYVPRTLDIADLVEHRVRQGAQTVNTDAYLRSMKNLIDPKSGEPIGKDAVRQRIFVPATKLYPAHIKLGQYMSPGPEYIPIQLGVNHVPIYIRHGFHPLVNMLTMKGGGISASPFGKAALQATGLLKHSVILVLDTFHPMRLGQYAMFSTGLKGYKGALTALEYNERDLPQAVARGLVSAEAARWANKPVTVTMPTGRKAVLTRRQILDEAVSNGLNVGRIQDALYRNLVQGLDVTVGGKRYGLGAYNRWVFDKFTRGMMAMTAVKAFEKLNNAHPEMDAHRLMRDVVKDTNIYYGSLGRQGVIKNPTYREISQLLFLAPQWVESLIQKELRFASRLTGVSQLTGRKGLPYLGQMGKAVGRGLAAYFAFTQALNLVSRGHFTWQNKEPGHELDAWIPFPWDTGKSGGYWLSPLSVFAEVLHDVLRLTESKPSPFHAIRQIGDNKLGPWGRLLVTMATLESPTGIRPQTLAGTAGIMAEAAAPMPISLARTSHFLAHKAAPGLVGGTPPGAFGRQLAAMAGIKVEPGRTPSQNMHDSAQKWVKDQGLFYKPYLMSPTEEANYDKLRMAIRNEDLRGATAQLQRLRQFKSDTQIIKGMKNWSRAPFTGRTMYEKWFLGSMDDESRNVYSAAVGERMEDLDKFLDFMANAPDRPKQD